MSAEDVLELGSRILLNAKGNFHLRQADTTSASQAEGPDSIFASVDGAARIG